MKFRTSTRTCRRECPPQSHTRTSPKPSRLSNIQYQKEPPPQLHIPGHCEYLQLSKPVNFIRKWSSKQIIVEAQGCEAGKHSFGHDGEGTPQWDISHGEPLHTPHITSIVRPRNDPQWNQSALYWIFCSYCSSSQFNSRHRVLELKRSWARSFSLYNLDYSPLRLANLHPK